MDSIKIKSYLKNELTSITETTDGCLYEIRRFDLRVIDPPVNQYDKLIAKIRDAYIGLISVKGFKVYWIDDEGEEVGFCSDKELHYAIKYWQVISAESSMLKIIVKNIRDKDNKKAIKPNSKTTKVTAAKSKEDLRLASPTPVVKRITSPFSPATKNAPTTPEPATFLLCTGCDQKLVSNQFKSYVCPTLNLCQQCQSQNYLKDIIEATKTHDSQYLNKIPATNQKKVTPALSRQQISEFGQKSIGSLHELAKKVQSNVKVRLSEYSKNNQDGDGKELTHEIKMSEIVDEDEGLIISEEEVAKTEEIAKALAARDSELENLEKWSSEPLKSKVDLAEEEFQLVGEAEKLETKEVVEITDEVMADTLLYLKIKGIEDDENGFVRELIRMKKANVDKVVDAYFNLDFQGAESQSLEIKQKEKVAEE